MFNIKKKINKIKIIYKVYVSEIIGTLAKLAEYDKLNKNFNEKGKDIFG